MAPQEVLLSPRWEPRSAARMEQGACTHVGSRSAVSPSCWEMTPEAPHCHMAFQGWPRPRLWNLCVAFPGKGDFRLLIS